MVEKFQKIDTSLCRKGFVRDEKGDHIRYRLYVDGAKTEIRTMISHNRRPIPDSLISIMAKELRLSKKDYLRLINCTLSGEEDARRLKDSGLIRQ